MHSAMSSETKAAEPKSGKQKVVVIKVGTSSLLYKGHLHLSLLGALAETCADLARAGCKVIVVTSGAVGAGCQVLDTTVRGNGKQLNPTISMLRSTSPHLR